jgi:hypothetical protein
VDTINFIEDLLKAKETVADKKSKNLADKKAGVADKKKQAVADKKERRKWQQIRKLK